MVEPAEIPVTFKFFVYTFLGSLLMLVAFLYIYQQTPIHSFSWDSLVSTGKSIFACQSAMVVLDVVHRFCHQDAGISFSHLATGCIRTKCKHPLPLF
jgi:hypothetical protein